MIKLDNIDVAVIGGGPAGLSAALSAKRSGAKRVLVIERSEDLGGLLHQCIHSGFGVLYFGEDLTGPEYAERLIDEVEKEGIEFLLETMVLSISKDLTLRIAGKKTGYAKLKPKAIVLAMGCRERTRGPLMIPGTRPAGILTSGTAQRFVNVEGFIPGRRFFILGSGDVGMIMARRLSLEGAEVLGVAEILPYVGGLVRNEVQCLRDFNIPIFLRHTVTKIYGEKRVEGVRVERVDEQGKPIPGTSMEFECDTLLLSVGLIPENELTKEAGISIDPLTGGPFVSEDRSTSLPGVFAGGNVLHVHDLVDNVSWESEIAGSSAAHFAIYGKSPSERRIRIKPGKNIRYVVPQFISGKKSVTLFARVTLPMENAKLKLGDIFERKERFVKPGIMIKIEPDEEVLSKAQGEELTLSCEGKVYEES